MQAKPSSELADILAGKTPAKESATCVFCWLETNKWIVDGMGKKVCEDEKACRQRYRERVRQATAEDTRGWD